MSEVLIKALEGQGIWATACILLVLYVLKETENRENKLLEIINDFKDHFGQLKQDVNIIKIDVDDIKESIRKGDK